MIAPFWAALDTGFPANDGIYIDTSVAGYVTIRFAATPTSGNSWILVADFAVRLGMNDGSIRFDYGAN